MLRVINGDCEIPPPPLSMMAMHKEFCIVCLAHLPKNSARRTLNSGLIKHVVPVLREASAWSPYVMLGINTVEHVFSSNHQVDLSKAMVTDTHNHTQTRCILESWHIQHHQSPLNRERGTLPRLYAALLAWPSIHLASSNYCFFRFYHSPFM